MLQKRPWKQRMHKMSLTLKAKEITIQCLWSIRANAFAVVARVHCIAGVAAEA